MVMEIIAFLQQLPFFFSMSLEEATGTVEQRTLYERGCNDEGCQGKLLALGKDKLGLGEPFLQSSLKLYGTCYYSNPFP